MGLILF